MWETPGPCSCRRGGEVMRPAHFIVLFLVPATLILPSCARPARVSHPAISPTGAGAVACAEAAARDAGLGILRSGGSAADAAVAVALALAVVQPNAGNLGGGGFAVVRSGEAITTLDFRETAPRAASHDMFLGPDGKAMPGASLVGGLAAGVPGSPSGLFELHHRHGVLPWRTVVEPALRLARDGFTVSQRLHDAVEWERDLLARFPETAAVWLPRGKPPEPGSVMKLPELAATLAAYAERGPEAIMSGPVAAAVA